MKKVVKSTFIAFKSLKTGKIRSGQVALHCRDPKQTMKPPELNKGFSRVIKVFSYLFPKNADQIQDSDMKYKFK